MAFAAALALPVVNAQVFGGSSLSFVILNAVVIGIVLFLLQAILVPNKEGKEKTSMWFIVIAASLLIAWVFGRNGYIW